VAVIAFTIGRAFVAALFGAAVVAKLSSRRARLELVAAVRAFRVVPARWAPLAAVAVIAAELTLVALAVAPGSARAGLIGAACVLAGFAAVIAAAVRRGIAAPCRCFGATSRPVGAVHVVRNAAAAVLAATAAVTAPDRGASGVELALGALGGAVAAALVLRFDDLVELFGPIRIAR
jgi:hypothetical protein